MNDATVPIFTKLLSNVDKWLDKAAAHADARKFDVDVLANARLAPDQYAFVRQIQSACDQAKFTVAKEPVKQSPFRESVRELGCHHRRPRAPNASSDGPGSQLPPATWDPPA